VKFHKVIQNADGICYATQMRKNIQGVPGGKDLTSGECSLVQTIPI
jgi:hypothetical protein